MENKDTDPKVIAIKLPFDLQERVLAFPFLHAISERFPKADLHFITPKKDVEVLNLLPFKAYYHLFDENEIKTVFDVHPYTANAAIYNVDVFYSLTNSFTDACLGIGLRAKKRVGFSDNWKTLVLTDKTLRPVGHHLAEDFLSLYELGTGDKFNKRLKVTSRTLAKIVEGNEPYIAINLSPLRNAQIEDEWIELISHFENQKIVLFAGDEQVKMGMLLDNFIERLPKTNTYVKFYWQDMIELGRMLSYSQGVISYSGAIPAIAAYVGAKAVILYENENPQRSGPFYFLTDVAIMAVNNPAVVNSTNDSSKVIKDRKTFNMGEVFAKAVELFRL